MIRSFVLSGWLGRGVSGGMAMLLPQLSAYGRATFHTWRETADIVREINRSTAGMKVCVIGYSSGGAMLGFMERGNKIKGLERIEVLERDIDLGVAYDPRGPGALGQQNFDGDWVVWVERYRRLLDYHSRMPWPGDMTFTGPGVEVWGCAIPHPLVQLSPTLHQRTLAAVRKLAEDA